MVEFFIQDKTTYISSDAENEERWMYEIANAREKFLDSAMGAILPQAIWRKAADAQKQYEVKRWLRQNGYAFAEDHKTMHYAVIKELPNGEVEIVVDAKVCLQRPKSGHCRLCGEKLTAGSAKDVHGGCEVKELLHARVFNQKRIVRPDFN